MKCPNCDKHMLGTRSDEDMKTYIFSIDSITNIKCSECEKFIRVERLERVDYRPVGYVDNGTIIFVKRREDD